MAETTATGPTPEVEALVWRDGEIIHRQFCDTTDEAAALSDVWSDQPGVTVTIRDIAASEATGDPVEEVVTDIDAEGFDA